MQLNFVCFDLVFYNFAELNFFISSSSVFVCVCVCVFGIFNIQDHVICNDIKFYLFLSSLDAFYFSVLPKSFGKNF